MPFADLKNEFGFWRVFTARPHLLRALLDDLLDRRGAAAIVGIEELPSLRPQVEGAKWATLGARCTDGTGATFVVEVQFLHLQGYVNRAVVEACQVRAGDDDAAPAEVVVISMCEFELWPDARQDERGLPHVPMLSRWNRTEQRPKGEGVVQVQYVFVELPKAPVRRPEKAGADLWAWLFVNALVLKEVPGDLPAGPFREALERADKATFTPGECEAYQRVWTEIQQVVEMVAERRAKAKRDEMMEGSLEGRTAALLGVLAVRGLPVSADARARVEACKDVGTLDRWIARAVTAASVEEVLAAAGESAGGSAT